ncbi:MAG: hypothetical protein ACRDWI_17625 [Jiangellaceae bacterium]
MTNLWCADCHDVRDFEPVPDGHETEHSCAGCGAALVVSVAERDVEPAYTAVA